MLVGKGLEGQKQTVVLMTEPYTFKGRITNMPSGTKAIYDKGSSDGNPPRAGIVASLDLNITSMDRWCNRDCAVALTRVGGVRTVLISLYLDITLEVQPEWLDELMQMLDQKGYPMIMGVDSNAHSSLYGPDNNARGNAFEDFIMQYGLNVENIGNTPTFEIVRGARHIKTHIDVTLTRDLTANVLNWRVLADYNASDHNTVRYEIESRQPEPELIRPWSKADWETLANCLKKAEYNVPRDMSMKKLDRLVERLYKILDNALDKACPKIEVKPVVGKVHWATDRHEKGKKKVNALYKHAKETKDQNDWNAYKKADKDFKRLCKNDKNRAWRKYKECIQSEKEMASLAKAAQWQEKRDINVLVRHDLSLIHI